MTRGQSGKHKNKGRLSQTPEHQLKPDGLDIEFSQEFADHEDIEALQRAAEADRRANKK